MSPREVLPQRRRALSFEFRHVTPSGGGTDLRVQLGYYDDGRIGEVFISTTKVGTDLDTAYREAAMLLSFALQHGCVLQTVRAAMLRDANGRPEGVVGALLDAILAFSAAPATAPPPAAAKPVAPASETRTRVERAWRELLEKDDRTSPEEHPDMVLVTFDELLKAAAAEDGP